MSNKKTGAEQTPKRRRIASPYAFYAAGGVFLLWGLVLPLYKIAHYALAGLAAAAAYALAAKLLPATYEEIREEPVVTGDALADSVVQEGKGYLARLADIRGRTLSQTMCAGLLSIDGTVNKILAAIQSDPKKAPMVRKLMSYYLPTLIKLAGYYETLEKQGGEGENIAGSLARIENNVNQLDVALRNQLDRLFERDALDITTDITVMENMLAQEGLTGGLQAQAEEEAEGGIVLTLNGEE